MRTYVRLAMLALMIVGLAGCESTAPEVSKSSAVLHPNETPELHSLIAKYSTAYKVPTDLVHRVVIRESTYNPGARNGPYYGLMQILPATARQMGYQGKPSGLLDPETNLKYGVKYLSGAWMVADGSRDKAVHWYSRGYYYEAKKRGVLKETGLR